MTAVSAFGVLLESCREISSNSSQRARTLSRLHLRHAYKPGAQSAAFTGASSTQDQNLLRPPVSQPGPKQVTIRSTSRARKGKSKQNPNKQLSEPMPADESRQEPVAAPIAAAHHAMFPERLHDAQRIEDLFELLRDAEILTASEVAQLPMTLLQLYKQRSAKEQQAVATHAFFESLVKPWALEPSKLSTQEQLATMRCLLEMNQWNNRAGNALTRAIIMVSNAVKNSLQATPNEFAPKELVQVLTSCNNSVTLRQACPQLALACLTACVRQLEQLSPDQVALVAFLSAQTHLRLNLKGVDQMRDLVRAGAARAPSMTALSLTQFMFGAVASGWLKPAHMQVLAACAVRSVPQCNAAALKNMMWALGTASFHHEQLLKAIEAQLLSQSPHLGAAHIATSIWAFGRLNHLPHLPLMQELANQAMLNSGSFTTKRSKQLLWGWYTLRFYPPDALLEAIAKRLTPLVHNMDARTVSEFIWAFGGLNYEPSNMQLFLQAAQDKSWQMNAIDISQTMRGLANMRLGSRLLVQSLVHRAATILDTFNPQALANLAWSMAHLGYKQEAVLDAIVNRLLSDVDSMNQRDVADLLSALAILKHQPVGEAMAAVMHHTIELLQDSETPWMLQDLSTICWSLAKLNVGNRKLLDLIYDRVLIDIPVMSAKDISYQIWGFAALGYPLPPQVLATYWERLQHVLEEIDPVDLSHVMWAMARFDSYPAPGLLDAVLATLPPQIASAEPAAVATTAHACGELRHHPRDAVLAALEDHAQQFSSDYTCADWSALIQSFTRLYAKPHRLYPLLLQEIVSGDLEMDTKLISDCLMSLALFEAWQEPLYLHLVTKAHALPLAAYSPKSLRQTYQVDLLAQHIGTVGAVDLPESFKSQAQTHWHMTQLGFNTTRLVRDLCAVLDSLQIPFQTGVSEAVGLLRIDLALPDQQVAIEALGPLKVLRNRPAATGRAVHRQRILAALGWTVVPVRERDWLRLKTFAEKQDFLRQLLEEPFCVLSSDESDSE
ncbi:hypothetical protein ABBQ38_010255 [Trebouxia sp. C0009 RCD-2024]